MMESKYRTVIVDDERLARERLKALLMVHPEIEVVAEADSVDEAVDALTDSQVDLIFLDVQMPGGNGFELFKRFDVCSQVVFVTAHDDFAIRAFEVNALDYLLKPISQKRLQVTIEKLVQSKPDSSSSNQENLNPGDKLCLRQGSSMNFVDVGEVTAILANGDYCDIYLNNGDSHLVGERLASFERRLEKASFLRIHRGALVNLAQLTQVVRQDGSTLVNVRGMKTPLTVSRRRLADFRQALGEIAPSK